ncbi:MAG: DUF4340 domain-containing protein [Kiloniellales bacterium]
MPSKALIALAAVTALSVVAAAVAVHQRAVATAQGRSGEPLLPGLMDRINDVATIRLQRADGPLTLEFEDGHWRLAEKGGYPARFEAVKTALVALARLRTIEAKTAKPALYPKLEVEDPGQAGAKSTLMTLFDAAGTQLASIIVGKTRDGSLGIGRAGVYVRRPGEARAWLAEGDPKLPDEAAGWLDQKLVNIARDRVAAAVLSQPDGTEIEISREHKEQKDFTLSPMPEGHKIKSAFSVNSITWVPERLIFDDVRRADDVDFTAAEAREATFRSFDGLILRLTLAPKDGEIWARMEASAAEDAAPEMAEEAAEITARTEGWAFRFSELKVENLTTLLADLVEPEKG